MLSPAVNGSALSTATAGAAGRMDLLPLSVSKSVTVDRLEVDVTTAVTSSTFRLAVYDSKADGTPNTALVATSGLNGAVVANGVGQVISPLTLTPGVEYWVAILSSASIGYRVYPVAALLALPSSGASTNTVLRLAGVYANGFVNSPAATPQSVTFPAIRLRVA